jgi:hypothetical protein
MLKIWLDGVTLNPWAEDELGGVSRYLPSSPVPQEDRHLPGEEKQTRMTDWARGTDEALSLR